MEVWRTNIGALNDCLEARRTHLGLLTSAEVNFRVHLMTGRKEPKSKACSLVVENRILIMKRDQLDPVVMEHEDRSMRQILLGPLGKLENRLRRVLLDAFGDLRNRNIRLTSATQHLISLKSLISLSKKNYTEVICSSLAVSGVGCITLIMVYVCRTQMRVRGR